MSWLFAVFPLKNKHIHSSNDFEQRLRATTSSNDFEQRLRKNPNACITESSLFLRAGGTKNSCFLSQELSSNKGWVALGNAIVGAKFGNYTFADSSKWEQLLSKESGEIKEVNGHYVCISWDSKTLKIQSDVLGLRDVYVGVKDDLVYLSTRVDWLTPFLPSEIDFKRFGSRWACFNQLSTRSVIKGINRVVSGASVHIDRASGSIDFQDKPRIYEGLFKQGLDTSISAKELKQQYFEELAALIALAKNSAKTPSLALSGGLDSRVLLALMVAKGTIPIDCHTFGDANHNDTVLAKKIANTYSAIRHRQLNRPFPKVEDCVAELEHYVAQTLVGNPASLVHKLNNALLLGEEYDANTLFIDGAFGEIWRRSFLNRLAIKGATFVLKNANNGLLAAFVAHKRANIFSATVEHEMEDGIKEDLKEIISSLPEIQHIGFENWLDLFAIVSRIPNMYGHEQARLDEVAHTFMPFIQPSLLKYVVQMPVSERKNSRLFKQMIKNNEPTLAQFWLAKSGHNQPFWLNTLSSRVWALAHKKMMVSTTNTTSKLAYLTFIQEYINDQLLTKDAVASGIYDVKKLAMIKEDFQSGKHLLINDLDWFVSMELFRQSIK